MRREIIKKYRQINEKFSNKFTRDFSESSNEIDVFLKEYFFFQIFSETHREKSEKIPGQIFVEMFKGIPVGTIFG